MNIENQEQNHQKQLKPLPQNIVKVLIKSVISFPNACYIQAEIPEQVKFITSILNGVLIMGSDVKIKVTFLMNSKAKGFLQLAELLTDKHTEIL